MYKKRPLFNSRRIHLVMNLIFGAILSLLFYGLINASTQYAKPLDYPSLDRLGVHLYQQAYTTADADSSFLEFDTKLPKYRKKYQHIVDSSIQLEPIETVFPYGGSLLSHAQIIYLAPHFISGLRSFLYRLTYF